MCIPFNAALTHTHTHAQCAQLCRVYSTDISLYVYCRYLYVHVLYTLHMCLDMFVAFFGFYIILRIQQNIATF